MKNKNVIYKTKLACAGGVKSNDIAFFENRSGRTDLCKRAGLVLGGSLDDKND